MSDSRVAYARLYHRFATGNTADCYQLSEEPPPADSPPPPLKLSLLELEPLSLLELLLEPLPLSNELASPPARA